MYMYSLALICQSEVTLVCSPECMNTSVQVIIDFFSIVDHLVLLHYGLYAEHSCVTSACTYMWMCVCVCVSV